MIFLFHFHSEEKKCEKGIIKCVPSDNCDCKWAEWRDWATCTKTCGGGVKYRQREKLVNKRGNGASCSGDSSDSRICNDNDCPRCTDMNNVTYSIGSTMPSSTLCDTW